MTEKSMHPYRENMACNKNLETMLQATRQKGFTLIELMVTLVVLGVLLAVGIPSYVEWIQGSRMDAASRSLASALKHARSEAVNQQTVITVRSGTIAAVGDWATGIHVYTDADTNGNTAYVAGTDRLIKNLDLSMAGITVDPNLAGTNYISFTSSGLLNEGGNAIILALCDDRGLTDSSQININIVGRISITSPAATCTP